MTIKFKAANEEQHKIISSFSYLMYIVKYFRYCKLCDTIHGVRFPTACLTIRKNTC